MRVRLLPALVASVAVVAACGASPRPVTSPITRLSSAPASSTTTAGAQATTGPARTHSPASSPAAASTTVPLQVPAGEGGGPFSTRRTLRVPKGWTAEVWARVPDARIEAWSPRGDLLVSQPDNGTVTELTPRAGADPTARIVLRDLTAPQGLAFTRLDGREVLYVGESNELDRYPWSVTGIDGPRTVVVRDLPDEDPAGDDVHRWKDVAVTADGTVYFNVGSSSNANPDDRTLSPLRAVIMAVRPDGRSLRVVERGVRNGEGLGVAPDGTVWTAVNNRDQVPYPFNGPYGNVKDAFGRVIPAYVDEHPPDEVVPVAAGRDLGWPYCNPDQDKNSPVGSLADIPLVPDSVTDPGASHLNCSSLPRIQVGLPAHSAPIGLSFLEGTKIPAPWSEGAAVAVHGSWDRTPPRSPGVLWMRWNASTHTLQPAVILVTGFQNTDGSRWGRPVDAVAGPDGALYVSDDDAGAIYRLVPKG